MIYRLCLVCVLMSWVLPYSIHAGVLASVILKDGSIIHGDIVEMVEGTLKVESAFGAGEPFLITWGEVENIATSQPVVFVLGNGASLTGQGKFVLRGFRLQQSRKHSWTFGDNRRPTAHCVGVAGFSVPHWSRLWL